MDHEYLQNVMGSPFVNEGGWDRFKAKAAQAGGALGAMAGHQIQNPNETQLRSLWEGFIKSLKKSMADWEEQVAPMFGPDVPLQGNAQLVKEALDTLAQILKSQGPSTIGQAPGDPQDRTDRLRRDAAKGNEYTGKSPSMKSMAPPQPPSDPSIKEGFMDAARRDTGLNKALGSNDPTKILDSYKNAVVKLFQNFMKDAVKMTKLSAQQIYSTLAKMQPAKSGWQPAANMQKVVEQLQKLQKIGDLSGAPPVIPQQQQQQPQQPPPIPQQKKPEPYSGPTPPVIQPPKIEPEKGKAPAPADGSQPPPVPPTGKDPNAQDSGQVPSGDGGQVTAQEMPHVILKALKIIRDAVTSDMAHTGKFFDKDEKTNQYIPLPTDADAPLLTKEVISLKKLLETTVPPKPKNKPVVDPQAAKETDDERHREYPNEFIYNFHSRHNKQPGTQFAIQVKPVNESPELTDAKGQPMGISVEVWWNSEGPRNKIYVNVTKGGKKSKPILIMDFMDQQAHSQAGGTTQGHTNFFTIEKMVKRANPYGGSMLDGADPNVLKQIQALQEDILRSFMAVTARKPMDFVPRRKNTLLAKYNAESGSVTYQDTADNQWKTIGKDEVQKHLDGPKGKLWYDTLKPLGYFEDVEGVTGVDPEQTEEWFEAMEILKKQPGFQNKKLDPILANGWSSLKQAGGEITGQSLADASVEVYNQQKGGKNPIPLPSVAPAAPAAGAPTDISKIPAAVDAAKALMGLGYKGKEAIDAVTKAVEAIGPDKTVEEYTKAAMAKPKGGAAPAATAPATPSGPEKQPPVSGTAGAPPPENPVTAPVGGSAGGAAVSKEPTTPVSAAPTTQPPAQGAPKQQQKKKKEKQPIKIWKTEGGTMAWSNFNGENGGLNKDTIAKLKQKYPKEYEAALAQAKANGFKDPMADKPEQGKETPEQGGKQPLKELTELGDEIDLSNGRINPYQLVNFL